jgi:hypothetical protein
MDGAKRITFRTPVGLFQTERRPTAIANPAKIACLTIIATIPQFPDEANRRAPKRLVRSVGDDPILASSYQRFGGIAGR